MSDAFGLETDMTDDSGPTTDRDRALVYNPASGSGDHRSDVHALADEYGFRVSETETAGEGMELAADAVAEGADLVAAAGGDGTLHEVLNGVAEAGGLGEVTFAVVPTGTGNNFAANAGVESISHAFEVIDRGERRRIDLGHVRPRVDGRTVEAGADADGDVAFGVDGGRYFLNSCIGGITAAASAATTPESKSRFGVLAYVLETVERVAEFDAIRLDITTDATDEREGWHGEAMFVLVGNGRRFPVEKRTQADMEDGLFELTVVEAESLVDLAGEAVITRLRGETPEHITKLRSAALDVDVVGEQNVEFSLDGEMIAADGLRIETHPRAVELPVGQTYDPDPDPGAGIDPDADADSDADTDRAGDDAQSSVGSTE